ncbi:hypothetical protein SCWH03_34090 [Streptomyces pacificus]|uniref:Uncharacterized protein n=1 Tax=Streptomyces pacificus TaxID=2705029 RepID=A0A6A0AYX6_9ACTN|nr:hypothetical protein SCWH03_34090 [Streptomyces pacificus]
MRKVPAARRLRGPCESRDQAAVVLPDVVDDDEPEEAAADFESDDAPDDDAPDDDESDDEDVEEVPDADPWDFADAVDCVLPEEELRLSLR